MRVLVIIVLVSCLCVSAEAYLTPSQNLSEMIRHSGPYNGLNPTARPGEVLVRLPQQLNGVQMRWQSGHYRAGLYSGFLEKGDYVYAWVRDCSEYTEYTLSRGRCGNPAKPVKFRIEKPRKPVVCLPPAPCPPPCPPTVIKVVTVINQPTPEVSFEKSRYLPHRQASWVSQGKSEAYVGGWWLPTSTTKVEIERRRPNPCPPPGPPPPGPPPPGPEPCDPGGRPAPPPPASGPGGVP